MGLENKSETSARAHGWSQGRTKPTRNESNKKRTKPEQTRTKNTTNNKLIITLAVDRSTNHHHRHHPQPHPKPHPHDLHKPPPPPAVAAALPRQAFERQRSNSCRFGVLAHNETKSGRPFQESPPKKRRFQPCQETSLTKTNQKKK